MHLLNVNRYKPYRLEYKKWYCGHYHTEKKIDKREIMFENFDLFCGRDCKNDFKS